MSFLLYSSDVRAQDRSVRFHYLTMENGLPQNMVDYLLQDRHGFMWIGTWNGLVRYDGYEFERLESDSVAMNNFIYALHEDRFGNIWIGTRKGLFVYLYDNARLKHVIADNETEFQNFTITTIAPYQDEGLFIGTNSGVYQLEVLDAQANVNLLASLTQDNSNGVFNNSINTIEADRSGKVWIGTDDGVFIYHPVNQKLSRLNESLSHQLTSQEVVSIYEDSEGYIWLGTEFGLNRIDYLKQSVLTVARDISEEKTLTHNSVMDVIENNKGQLLLATLGGVTIINKSGEVQDTYTYDKYARHGLSNNFVNCLTLDRDGNIWMGTERGGVNYYNPDQSIFQQFEYKLNEQNSLNNATINSIYEDQNFIWIGTAGGGLNRYNKKTDQFHHYKHDPLKANSISSDFVTAIHRDKEGQLWLSTWGSGLCRMRNDQSPNPQFINYGIAELPGVKSNFISSIAEDEQGNLWIGTLGGIIKYDKNEAEFQLVFSEGNLKIAEVGCLMFDSDNRLWAGTRNGLFRINQPNNTFNPSIKKYINETNKKASLKGNYITSLLEDQEGNIWCGTYGSGINRLDVETEEFQNYSAKNGLGNDIVFSMEQDFNGQLWISTDYGLSSMDPVNVIFRNYYSSDGLLNDQYYWSASFRNEEGKLYFGGMNGMDAFFPEWIANSQDNKEVNITAIKILNESVKPHQLYNGVEVLLTHPGMAEEINLSYKEKVFSIEFASLNFLESDLIRYAYQLEGFENQWNYLSSGRRFASFTNLTPGNYTFKVKASDAAGNFNLPPTVLKINIAPPFWETIWFRLIGAALLVGLVIGYIRWRTFNLKRQKKLLEQEVDERTRRINQQKEALSHQAIQLQHTNTELESKQVLIQGQNEKLELQNKEILDQRDKLMGLNKKLKLVSQLRLSFFTNVSHEFKTPLTLIVGPLKSLLEQNKWDNETTGTLAVMNRNAQRLLHLVNQIMDFRKIEQGKMELKVTKGDIQHFCREIFEAFSSLAKIKRIDFNFNMTNVPEEVWFDPEKVENILYNLLSNAFKYTPEGGHVGLSLRGITPNESRLDAVQLKDHGRSVLFIAVTDSGVGISEENLPLVFKRFYRIESEEALKIGGSGIGLSLTEELIKTHHGDIFVKSNVGEGSSFEVEFPCLRHFYNNEEIIEQGKPEIGILDQIEFLKEELTVEDEGTSQTEETKKPIGYKYKSDRPTLLIVEDNVDLRKFMALKLNESFNILEAGDGRKGIQLAKKKDPDLIISDVMMPHTDGMELCSYIKQHLDTCHIPVILLTAKSSIEHQIEGLEIGADDYLPKPFNFDLLLVRIQNLLEKRNTLRMQYLHDPANAVQEITTNSKDHDFLEKAIETMEQNLSDSSFDVSEFIRAMGVSRSLLHKKLTSLTSQSTSEFMNVVRLKKAHRLLGQGTLNISEVAYAVGYNDPKYFSRLFSKFFGQSPKEFLQANMNEN